MQKNKKVKIYINEIAEDIVISYPNYYVVSQYLSKNEMLLFAIESLHRLDFKDYYRPKSFDDIFTALKCGSFAIYKEKYIIGSFGYKLMYLEANGWKSMNVTQDVFNLNNWLIC